MVPESKQMQLGNEVESRTLLHSHGRCEDCREKRGWLCGIHGAMDGDQQGDNLVPFHLFWSNIPTERNHERKDLLTNPDHSPWQQRRQGVRIQSHDSWEGKAAGSGHISHHIQSEAEGYEWTCGHLPTYLCLVMVSPHLCAWPLPRQGAACSGLCLSEATKENETIPPPHLRTVPV